MAYMLSLSMLREELEQELEPTTSMALWTDRKGIDTRNREAVSNSLRADG